MKVFPEISLTVFTEQAMKDRSNPELQTQQHCNGNGGRSIQWIKLVQHEKDGTQQTHNELTDWTNSWLTSRPDTQPELDKLTTSQVDYTRNLRLN